MATALNLISGLKSLSLLSSFPLLKSISLLDMLFQFENTLLFREPLAFDNTGALRSTFDKLQETTKYGLQSVTPSDVDSSGRLLQKVTADLERGGYFSLLSQRNAGVDAANANIGAKASNAGIASLAFLRGQEGAIRSYNSTPSNRASVIKTGGEPEALRPAAAGRGIPPLPALTRRNSGREDAEGGHAAARRFSREGSNSYGTVRYFSQESNDRSGAVRHFLQEEDSRPGAGRHLSQEGNARYFNTPQTTDYDGVVRYIEQQLSEAIACRAEGV